MVGKHYALTIADENNHFKIITFKDKIRAVGGSEIAVFSEKHIFAQMGLDRV